MPISMASAAMERRGVVVDDDTVEIGRGYEREVMSVHSLEVGVSGSLKLGGEVWVGGWRS